jgi:hypothetical protein
MINKKLEILNCSRIITAESTCQASTIANGWIVGSQIDSTLAVFKEFMTILMADMLSKLFVEGGHLFEGKVWAGCPFF